MGINAMYSEEQLLKRNWPQKPAIPVTDYCSYVTLGRVFNRALRLRQALSEPIPPGECAITSLCLASKGKIYGATSGRQSHLFVYDPAPQEDGVYDLCQLEGCTAVYHSLVAAGDYLYGAITEGNNQGSFFRYSFKANSGKEKPCVSGEIRYLPPPIPGESVTGLVLDANRFLLYGIGRKTGTLFCYDLSGEKLLSRVQLDRHGFFSETIVLDQEGNVYGCAGHNYFFKASPGYLSLQILSFRLPTVAGRNLYNRLQAAVFHEKDNLIYGAGSADGLLFAFSPNKGKGYTIGKVTAAAGCPVLILGKDDCLYGLNGAREGMAHLFRYELASRCLDDLGILYASSEIPWHGYEFACGCLGSNGEIYFGECDRISHLFMYFPPYGR